MATQKKFLAIYFILVVVFVLTTGFHAFAGSMPVMTGTEAVRESVTGTVTETLLSDGIQFLHITPISGGDEVWVAVPGTVSVNENTQYTFEGPVWKNYKVKILQRNFKTIILSSGPQ